MSRLPHVSGDTDWNLDDSSIQGTYSASSQAETTILDPSYCGHDDGQDNCGLSMDANPQYTLGGTLSDKPPSVPQVARASGMGIIGEEWRPSYQNTLCQALDQIVGSGERDASIQQQQQQQSPASSTSTSSRSISQLSFNEARGKPEEGEKLAETKSEAEDDAVGEISLTAMERLAGKRKMKRFRLTHSQTRFLMSEFSHQAHPDSAHRERLSRDIPGLSPRQVQVWFQNRRAKLKRLTSDDQDRMIRSRAIPAGFDLSQTLHPDYGERRQSSSMFNQTPDPTLLEKDVQRRPQNTPFGPSDGRNVPPLSITSVSGRSSINSGLAAGSETISPVSSVYDGSAYSGSSSPAIPHLHSSNPFSRSGGFPPNSNVYRSNPGFEGQQSPTRARARSLAGLITSTTQHGYGKNSVLSEPDNIFRPRAASSANPSPITTSSPGYGNQSTEGDRYQQQLVTDSTSRKPSQTQGLGGMASLQVTSPLSSTNSYPENQQVLMRGSTFVTAGYSTVPNHFDFTTANWASRPSQPNNAPQDPSLGYYSRPAFYHPQAPPTESPQPAGPGYQPFGTSSTINTSFNLQTTTLPDGHEGRSGAAAYPAYFGRAQ